MDGCDDIPVVQFTTRGGSSIRFDAGASSPHREAGEIVPVVYDILTPLSLLMSLCPLLMRRRRWAAAQLGA